MSKIVSKGLDLGAEPPRKKLSWVPPPPHPGPRNYYTLNGNLWKFYIIALKCYACNLLLTFQQAPKTDTKNFCQKSMFMSNNNLYTFCKFLYYMLFFIYVSIYLINNYN